LTSKAFSNHIQGANCEQHKKEDALETCLEISRAMSSAIPVPACNQTTTENEEQAR